jgi:hypothetical protein
VVDWRTTRRTGSTSGVPLGRVPCHTAMQVRTPVKPIRYSGAAIVVSCGWIIWS